MWDIRERIRRAVHEMGASHAARALGMDREVVLAIAAGAKVREASLVMAETRLPRLEGRPQS
jgi:hypothetical protein